MNLKSTLLALTVSMFSYFVNSQEGLPVYTDYLTDNYYLLHPSMAGAANCAKVRLTGRQQWFGNEDAPKLLTLSVNSRIGDSQSAVGGIAYTDKNGFHSQNGAYATYAHHILFSRNPVDLNMLSFGLNVGFIQYILDESSFLLDGPDPIIKGNVQSSTNLNVDFGMSYHFLDYYAHATVKNLIKNDGINNEIQVTDNLRRFLFSVGGIFSKYGSSLSFEPSVLYSYRDGTKESQVDVNIKAYKKMDFGKLWGGLSYRQSIDGINGQNLTNITPILGVDYDTFVFAYNYTQQTNSLVFTNGGFHQITLGYNFNCRKEKYACNCPAVN